MFNAAVMTRQELNSKYKEIVRETVKSSVARCHCVSTPITPRVLTDTDYADLSVEYDEALTCQTVSLLTRILTWLIEQWQTLCAQVTYSAHVSDGLSSASQIVHVQVFLWYRVMTYR